MGKDEPRVNKMKGLEQNGKSKEYAEFSILANFPRLLLNF